MRRGREADGLQRGLRTLRVAFETLEGFRREYRENLVRGGLFVPTTDPLELREEVKVELELAFRSARIPLRGEVVAVVPAGLAQAGGTPGVALQLLGSPDELRRTFEPIVGQAPEPDPGSQPGERRTARRRVARAVGRLATQDADLAVRTRNLSRSGVLVSLEGIPPTPVGETVRLDLMHPVNGKRLAVEGTVVRHVEQEGVVVALAVAFSEEEADRQDVRRFVDELQATAHARDLGAISGPLQELGVASLLQGFAAGAPRGTLTLVRGAEEGRVAFENGMLVDARVGAVSGMKAVARLLAWDEGRFEFHAQLDEEPRDMEAVPLEAALLDAARQMDERGRLGELPFAMGDRLRPAAPPPDAGTLSKTEAAVLDLARAGFSVRAMLDVIPDEDHVVLETLAGLLDRGVVESAGPAPARS